MELKDFWSKTNSWLQTHKLGKGKDYEPELDSEGLITEQDSSKVDSEPEVGEQNEDQPDTSVMVKAVEPAKENRSLDKLESGFERLIEQLQGINVHLNEQITEHKSLMGQLNRMPSLLEGFPGIVENQQQLTAELIEQLKGASAKNQQFIESVEKIPAETGKQTDALVSINHQLAASADTDVQMAENFNKFNQVLDKLDQTTAGQTDSIMQMSKTFVTSDRYLKYLMSRQNKRFMWIFMTAMGVCVFTILLLTGIIIYLKQ